MTPSWKFRPRSLKTRIATIAGLVMTLMMVIIGLVLREVLYVSKIDSIDQQLESGIVRIREATAPFIARGKPIDRAKSELLRIASALPLLEFAILTPEAQTVFQTQRFPTAIDASNKLAPPSESRFQKIELEQARWRYTSFSDDNIEIRIAANLRILDEELTDLTRAIWLSSPILLIIGSGACWLIAHSSLARLNRMVSTLDSIDVSALKERISDNEIDAEFKTLIEVFNRMLDRLENTFNQATRFSADAAHELKTPLTIMQGQLEAALLRSIGTEEQTTYSSLLDELQRLKSITEKLLLLSRSDSGSLNIRKKTIQLSQLVESVCEDAEILGPSLKFYHQIDPGIEIEADPSMLQQVLNNLMSNAIKYNVRGGHVKTALSAKDGFVVWKVRNSGPAITREEAEHLFDRFYRVDKSRNRAVEGTGLGLSLAKEITSAHRGIIELESSRNGENTFSLTLPQR